MGEVRKLPTSADPLGGNAILCRQCHARELAWREERNKDLEPANRFPLPEWGSLDVYPGKQSARYYVESDGDRAPKDVYLCESSGERVLTMECASEDRRFRLARKICNLLNG